MGIVVLKGDVLLRLVMPSVFRWLTHTLCLTLQGSNISSSPLTLWNKIADFKINRLGDVDERMLIPTCSTNSC